MLLLKRHLLALVRAGKKSQTLRFWSHAHFKPGQITFTPGLGKLRIDAIDLLPNLAAITETDALADGFPSKAALLAELKKIYGPNLPPNKKLFRIRFTWPLETPTPPHPPTPKSSTPPLPPQKPPTPPPTLPKPLPATAAKPLPQKTRMTPTQRQKLHTYILIQARQRSEKVN